MAIQGVQYLPPGVSMEDYISILEKLPEVTNKIGRLDEKFKGSIVSSRLIRTLSLSESVQSTRIEGTQVTFSDMMEEKDDAKPRSEIIEVNNYQRALLVGYEQIRLGYPISVRLVRDLHSILMEDARGSTQASGEFRKIQNFIGPTNRIEDATYIPIPANEIHDYMRNWEYYINGHPYEDRPLSTEHIKNKCILDENCNPLIKTAIIHAQFESIHPFLDGNGRLGRILIVLYLVQSKLITYPVFFLSEELEREKARYYDLLNGVRGDNPDWGSWILFFLKGCERMANKLIARLEESEKLAKEGLEKCNTNTEKMVWLYTFSNPFVTSKIVAESLNISPNTARKALNSLVEKKMLFTDKYIKRNRKYRNYDLMSILS